MDRTPTKSSRADAVRFDVAADQPVSPRRSTRIKKPPPITPRRFNRFFTPRLKNDGRAVKAASRKALKALSTARLNARPTGEHDPARPLKRPRLHMQSPSPSLPSSPIRHIGFLSSSQEHATGKADGAEAATVDPVIGDVDIDETDDTEASTDVEDVAPRRRVARYGTRGLSARLTHLRLSGSRAARLACGDSNWQEETAHFYSSSADVNIDHGAAGEAAMTLPFCTTSCKTNSLVAVGDEEGQVLLIDSANECSDEFKRAHLAMKPHENAVMDLEFSEDDYLLATASGDQTCQVIDVQAQKSLYALTGHTSSVKKIQFVPGSKDLLVTCSRDGTVAMWDTRIRLTEMPLLADGPSLTADMVGREPFKYIQDAHVHRSRPRSLSSRTDPSITSVCFVSPSQPHLFATASSSDSVVKLWDMRAKHKYRNKAVPISCTTEPRLHELHRRFGIASMVMSGDRSSFYTLCRDHTVYAYSTAHLCLGSAPDMSSDGSVFQARNGTSTGLGPMYGFRHPRLQVGTFYNRIALRKASDTNTELIAVGSSDDCAVLFPTAGRYLSKANRAIPSRSDAPRPRLTRTDSQSTSLALRQRSERDDIPIYYHGTPLVKGHNKEVTAVTWTHEGNLVTTSDDFRTRCWRQDAERARALRRGYDGDVERWASGWAEVSGDFDGDQ